ncbi:potassium-transporting ATPase subunit KdpC [Nocardioides sp. Soil805]|uniref:potassium-transporting ATPase subunit KdpC n=1 Tax=Nocardioides sp. Soil805 TaxID=1736416 RepID=UPI00070267CD|nr:potassium-transporting ATPase subunit KdpC [Nocardioides sp. Soil805]KRF30578.1 potassium transporter KtrA [Nocardioides sp. Soil805]
MESLFTLGRHAVAGLRTLVVLTLLLGLAYPLVVTGVAQAAFDWRASGSLVTADGERTTSYDDAVGSALIGQGSDGPEWFHPRPSAAGDGWDPLATGGSNLGPESPDLVATIEERRAAVAEEEGVAPAQVPADALTASASGLDPHVSPAYAMLQVPRVARANGLAEEEVRDLVEAHTDDRTLGFLGEPRVDVLALNIALAGLRD